MRSRAKQNCRQESVDDEHETTSRNELPQKMHFSRRAHGSWEIPDVCSIRADVATLSPLAVVLSSDRMLYSTGYDQKILSSSLSSSLSLPSPLPFPLSNQPIPSYCSPTFKVLPSLVHFLVSSINRMTSLGPSGLTGTSRSAAKASANCV